MNVAKSVKAILLITLLIAGLSPDLSVLAGESEAQSARVGPITNLPLPRYVSIKANKANVRRGPSTSHRIDWVFLKKYTPLEITAEYGNWRRVRDADGAGGWIHYSLLSGVRTVLIQISETVLKKEPLENATSVAIAEQGVIARLGTCAKLWCEISVDGLDGWVRKSVIWGVGDGEVRN